MGRGGCLSVSCRLGSQCYVSKTLCYKPCLYSFACLVKRSSVFMVSSSVYFKYESMG